MQISYVNGPFLPGFSRESRSPAVTKSGTLYYPAWLAYACGYAESKGIECSLIDCIADKLSLSESLDLVTSQAPKLIVLGTSTPSIEADLDFAKRLKDHLPGVQLCLVGTHASSTAQEILEENHHIDYIARREYDQTVVELFDSIESCSRPISEIAGLSHRSSKGEIIHNFNRDYIHDLDVIPFASQIYSKHLNIENYYYGHVRYPMVSIFTSRGCNAKCTYCVYPQTMFGMHRARSPKNIAAEFEWIKNNLPQVKEVLVDDDTFTMNPGHARQVANELIHNGNTLPWTCEVRSTLDKDTLHLMKLAGCRLVVVGFESSDQTVLRNIKKGTVQTQTQVFVNSCKDVGIKIHACFMAGNPGDTPETLTNTLNWALSQPFDTAQFFPVQLYPGTEAYHEAKENNFLLQKDYRSWVTKDGMHNMTLAHNNTGLTSEQILTFCDYARKRFYLRKSYIFRKIIQGVLSPQELKKNAIGFLNIRKHLLRPASNPF